MVFRINGEYGYELFAALPLINWYKEQGNDVVVDGVVVAVVIDIYRCCRCCLLL